MYEFALTGSFRVAVDGRSSVRIQIFHCADERYMFELRSRYQPLRPIWLDSHSGEQGEKKVELA